MAFFSRAEKPQSELKQDQKDLFSGELAILKESVLKNEPGKVENSAEDMEERIQKECVLITYALPGKTRSQKMLFNYELVGRNGKHGLLQRLGGKKVISGCLIVPAQNTGELETFLKKHGIEFSKIRILLRD